ncbi:hypothetical protein EOM86_09505 [Candidatus Nomurabacteria bacterium]|nr:hypothetical protein [Candidatus Nomurabacteria bacterium]
MEEKKMFEFGGNTYTIEFPNVGQYLDIEAKRIQFSKGTYNGMIQSNLKSSGFALDLVDMAATLSVLCPDLMKDLKSGNLFALGILDAKRLVEAYNQQLRGWMDDWMKILMDVPKATPPAPVNPV